VSPIPGETWTQVLTADLETMAIPFHLAEWVEYVCVIGGCQDAGRLCRTGEGRELLLPMMYRPRRPNLLAVRASLAPAGVREAFRRPEGCDSMRPAWFSPPSPSIRHCAPVSVSPSAPYTHGGPRCSGTSAYREPCTFSTSTAAWRSCGLNGGPRSCRTICTVPNTRRAGRDDHRERELVRTGRKLLRRLPWWFEQRALERHLPPAVVRSRGNMRSRARSTTRSPPRFQASAAFRSPASRGDQWPR
jgi:hypothetical protein